MNGDDIRTFMTIGGQERAASFDLGTLEKRKLGAQLLLSEVLEYVVDGLGIIPEFNGTPIHSPDELTYTEGDASPNVVEVVDGLADTAYTMYWNMHAFGIPLEEAFERVCKNNLQKFVELDPDTFKEGIIEKDNWSLGQNIEWPVEVSTVEAIRVEGTLYAVGRDENGKVRKPSSYHSVDLSDLVE